MDLAEFDGDDFPEKHLTHSAEAQRKPGRPQLIPDARLRHAQAELLFLMEENWALVGWDLQQTSSVVDIRVAFRQIQGYRSTTLELLCEEPDESREQPTVKNARRRLAAASEIVREAQLHCERCTEKAERVRIALKSYPDGQQPIELVTLSNEAKTALTASNQEMRAAQTEWMAAEVEVRQAEAAFAQSEVLDFIQSERYQSTPLTFANAMAGLPYIRWRQSMTRCLGFKDGAAHGLTYRRFQIVAEVFATPCSDRQEAVERMKTRLLKAKGQDVKPLNALAENWYFLKAAMEVVVDALPIPAEALPYRIFAEYKRRSETPITDGCLACAGRGVDHARLRKGAGQSGGAEGMEEP